MQTFIQDDQKVSMHLMMYSNRQVHRAFLITLYLPYFRFYLLNRERKVV
jgi:hypothetical protein